MKKQDIPSKCFEFFPIEISTQRFDINSGYVITVVTCCRSNIKPIIYAREVLKFCCKLFENLYEREIQELYTHFEGDISIFRKDPYSRQSLDKIIDDLFHLYLTFPFKIGSSRGKKISSNAKKVLQFAKVLVHKAKGQLLLEKLFNEVSKSFKFSNEETASLIYSLVENEVFLPLQEEKKKRFPIHF